MTPLQLANTLQKISYKPGARVGVVTALGGFQLILALPGYDVHTGQPGIVKVEAMLFSARLLEAMSVGEFVECVRAAILDAETHEMDEWLKLNGKHVTDPHPELKKTKS